jgi:plasmid stabilization system protein ParE
LRAHEEAAWQVILGIYDRVQVLRQFPESGHCYEKFPDKHIRILLYGHYRVAYLIRDENTIHILGVSPRGVRYRRTSQKNRLELESNLSPI